MVGRLQQRAGHVLVQHGSKRLHVRAPVFQRDGPDLHIRAKGVGAHCLQGHRMHALGDERHAALCVHQHVHGLGGGGGAVVDRGVGNVHAGQFADHRLVFKDGLQHALTHLRLIGRVGGDERLLGGHRADHGGYVVVVRARAAEDGAVDAVLRRHAAHLAGERQLRKPRREVELFCAQRLRHGGKQLLRPVKADGAQHFRALGARGGDVSAHFTPPRWRRRPRRPPRRAIPRGRKYR